MHLALLGPAGTGKTTVLLVVEAFIVFFLGSDSVRKGAVTNTAARLLGGDTVHALHKLPTSSLRGRTAKLSDKVLERFRAHWRPAHAQIIDELSVLGHAPLHQFSVRSGQAKRRPHKDMGGLATALAGDLLQLPPVKQLSLATPLDAAGRVVSEFGKEVGIAAMGSTRTTTSTPRLRLAKALTCGTALTR